MYEGRTNRDEKLSALKLAVVQYGILIMMLALIAGLWRLQVLGADNFRLLAEQIASAKFPSWRPAAKSSTAKTASSSTTTLRLLLPGPRDGPQRRRRPAPHRQGSRPRSRPAPRHPAPLSRLAGYQPIPIKQDITADEQAFIEAHLNELPSSKPSTKSAASIPATASPPTSSAMSAKSVKKT